MADPTPDTLPSSTAVNTAMEAAAFHHLVGAGMHHDRDLMRLIDISGVKKRSGGIGGYEFPSGFADAVRRRYPMFFAEHAAVFDARRASSAEADARFREINRGFHARAAAAETARVMSGLRGA